jgi:hypothetical protein
MKLCQPAVSATGAIGAAATSSATAVVTGNAGRESDTDADLNVDAVDADMPPHAHTHTHCKTFQIVYSAEFSRLHEQYSMIANSGDVNRLAVFLSQHPYHPEGAVLCCAVLRCAVL